MAGGISLVTRKWHRGAIEREPFKGLARPQEMSDQKSHSTEQPERKEHFGSNQTGNRGSGFLRRKLLVQRIKIGAQRNTEWVSQMQEMPGEDVSFLAQKGEFCSTHTTQLLLRSWSCYVLKALAFILISDWRSPSILQESIPWQAQALKCLMSSTFFALKQVTYLLKKDQAHSRAQHP